MWSLIVCVMVGANCIIEPGLSHQWLGSTLYKTEKECTEARSNPVILAELQHLTRNASGEFALMCTKPTAK
jgi:hypothetical protein